MKFLQEEEIIAEVEQNLGRPLNEMEKGCVKNAVDGYNGDGAGLKEIKESLHEAARGLLSLDEEKILEVLDITETCCDQKLRQRIVESN